MGGMECESAAFLQTILPLLGVVGSLYGAQQTQMDHQSGACGGSYTPKLVCKFFFSFMVVFCFKLQAGTGCLEGLWSLHSRSQDPTGCTAGQLSWVTLRVQGSVCLPHLRDTALGSLCHLCHPHSETDMAFLPFNPTHSALCQGWRRLPDDRSRPLTQHRQAHQQPNQPQVPHPRVNTAKDGDSLCHSNAWPPFPLTPFLTTI